MPEAQGGKDASGVIWKVSHPSIGGWPDSTGFRSEPGPDSLS